ncbi:MAG: cytochrome c biogenesis protein CcsA [bacterium]
MKDGLTDRILVVISSVMMLIAVYMIFFYAPTERVMGIVQKIFYFHLPLAFMAFLSYFVAFVCGVLYLIKKDIKWDIIGSSSVEIGVVFTTLVLITGSLWARPIWNTWWTWDPRLTSSLILWLIYVAYIILRMSVEQAERRATFCAVMAIVGFLDVPIVFLSARLWRTIHPVVIKSKSIDMEPAMITVLAISMSAFLLFWITLIRIRSRVDFMELRIRNLEKIKRGGME